MSDQKIQDQEPPIQGARLLKRAMEQFRQLESVGIECDVAGNRKLLYSHYAGLVLLSLFNPAMQSVRGLTDASKLRKVQQLIGNQKVSVGSFSESVRVFDPEHLRVIFEQSLENSPAAVTGGRTAKKYSRTHSRSASGTPRCERCLRLWKRSRRKRTESADCICYLTHFPVHPRKSNFALMKPEEITLLTSLVALPAHVIAAIYELRWSLNDFFAG